MIYIFYFLCRSNTYYITTPQFQRIQFEDVNQKRKLYGCMPSHKRTFRSAAEYH